MLWFPEDLGNEPYVILESDWPLMSASWMKVVVEEGDFGQNMVDFHRMLRPP